MFFLVLAIGGPDLPHPDGVAELGFGLRWAER